MQLPTTVFFDMDDTILADMSQAPQCWEQACRQFVGDIVGGNVGTLLDAIHESREWYWSDLERDQKGRLDLMVARRDIVSLAFSNLGIDAVATAIALADAYTTLKEQVIEVIPGAIETLRHLRANGARLALITNGHAVPQRAKIDRFGLESLFDCILIEGEFGVGKPDQRVFHHALAQLDTPPSGAMMVGDNLTADIAGSQSLGIHGVWVDWSGNGLPKNTPTTPDRTVRTISELVR